MWLNGECFVIYGRDKYTLPASTEFNLTVPVADSMGAYQQALGHQRAYSASQRLTMCVDGRRERNAGLGR